jgi:hypothetical protein
MQTVSNGWFDTPEEIRNFAVVVAFAALLLTALVFSLFRIWHQLQPSASASPNVGRRYTERVLEGLSCSIFGFLIGYADYIYRGVRFAARNPKRIYTAVDYIGYLFSYIYVGLFFSFSIIAVFCVLYFTWRDRVFRNWIVSLLLGGIVGAGAAYLSLRLFIHPGMIPSYSKTFLPRSITSGIATFALGAFFTWQARHLTGRCSEPLPAA